MSRNRVVSANPPSVHHQADSIPAPPILFPHTAASLASRSSSPAIAASTPNSENASRSGSPMSFSSSASIFSVPNGADINRVYEAYCRAQMKVTELENEVAMLKRQLADAKIQSSGKRPSDGSTESGANTEGGPPTAEEIQKRGRNHMIFSHIFQLDPSVFTSPRPSFNSTSLTRYTSPENQVAGLTAELYERLPPTWHEHMAAKAAEGKPCSTFVKLFRDAQSSIRSTILLNLRNEAGFIFNLPASFFSKTSSGPTRDAIPEIQALLGIDMSAAGAAAYPRFPPVLYLNGDITKIDGRFLSEYLFMAARLILFGKTAAANKNRAVARSSSSFLYTDQTVVTTFGLIAAIVIFVRYILSKDERFENDGIGPQTGINYTAEFEYYKRWLIEMSQNAASAPWIEHLVARWNEEVFFAHNKAKNTLPAGSDEGEVIQLDDGEAIRRDLEQLHLTSSASSTFPSTSETPATLESGSSHNDVDAAHPGPEETIAESQPVPVPDPPVPRTTRSRAQASEATTDAPEPSQARGRGRAKATQRTAKGKKGV